jgi:hypothetical protein
MVIHTTALKELDTNFTISREQPATCHVKPIQWLIDVEERHVNNVDSNKICRTLSQMTAHSTTCARSLCLCLTMKAGSDMQKQNRLQYYRPRKWTLRAHECIAILNCNIGLRKVGHERTVLCPWLPTA